MKPLIRFVCGTVDIEVSGAVERFINAAFASGAHIWNVRRTALRALSFTAYRSSLAALRRAAESSGTALRVIKYRGAPPIVLRYRARAGLLFGALLIAAGLYASSLFIWRVEVSGNTSVSDAEIKELLSQNGFNVGDKRRRSDISLVENACLLSTDKLSWMSINVIGTTAYVEVRERTDPPPTVDASEPCNIVAGRDGVIASIEAYMGYPVLSPGDTVTAGDLVVTGDYTDKYGVRSFHHSYAKVMAHTVRNRTVTVPLTSVRHVPTGRVKNKWSLNFIRFSIPLYFSEKIMYNKYDKTVSEHVLRLSDSFALPVSLIETRCSEVEETTVALSEEEAYQNALEQLRDYEYDLVGVQVVSRDVRKTVSADSVTLTLTLECIEDIGIPERITYGKNT